jgi:hypothetical protein
MGVHTTTCNRKQTRASLNTIKTPGSPGLRFSNASPRGRPHKLRPDQIAELQRKYEARESDRTITMQALAAEYGVSRLQVHRILHSGPASKNFIVRGERCHRAKLDERAVIDIRCTVDGTVGFQRTDAIHALASKYRVSQSTITMIVSRKRWKHVR